MKGQEKTIMIKTKNALKHDKQRKAQKEDLENTNHTELKTNQILKLIKNNDNKILELFEGNGKLTSLWNTLGIVETNKGKNAYRLFHGLIFEGKKYDIIDLDPYGFPSRFFPDIFLLMDKGFIFITFPHIAVNVLNGITKEHFRNYYDSTKPSITQIIEKINKYALCHWREIKLVDIIKMYRVFRLCFQVQKVKATEYCNVKNRPDKSTVQTRLFHA